MLFSGYVVKCLLERKIFLIKEIKETVHVQYIFSIGNTVKGESVCVLN
jgi:hypothetical protein